MPLQKAPPSLGPGQPNPNPNRIPNLKKKKSFGSRLASAFRSKKENEPPIPSPIHRTRAVDNVVQLRPQLQQRPTDQQTTYSSYTSATSQPQKAELDTQLGERKDNTAYLHALIFNDQSKEDERLEERRKSGPKAPSQHILSRIPKSVWERLMLDLEPDEAANLVLSSKVLFRTIGQGPWDMLNLPSNHQARIRFLRHFDRELPEQLLCFLCARYHRRLNPGKETLKPASVFNPLYTCPKAKEHPEPKTRITPRRTLPFTFAQLVMRRHLYGPAFGIPLQDLSRRWTEDHWSHTSKFGIIKGKLYMRVVSSTFCSGGLSPSEERLLLYSREDYSPYFSACAHWRDGVLMEVCKCALSHVPIELDLGGLKKVAKVVEDRMQQRKHDPASLVTLCAKCRPMRRCVDCPSEYLVEIKRMEDRMMMGGGFRRAVCVTRWACLGGAGTPGDVEWAAVNGEGKYDSVKEVGKRAISGIFESHFTEDTMPGQRLLSLNPRNEKHSDVDDPAWY